MSDRAAELSVMCKGRDFLEREVLAEPVKVVVFIRVGDDGKSIIASVSSLNCPHATGGTEQFCRASRASKGLNVGCGYAFKMPSPS